MEDNITMIEVQIDNDDEYDTSSDYEYGYDSSDDYCNMSSEQYDRELQELPESVRTLMELYRNCVK